MIIQFAATFYLGAIIVCFILFTGLCEFLVAFKYDLGQRILRLEEGILECSLRGCNRIASDNITTKLRLHKIFQFHSQALQLREHFNIESHKHIIFNFPYFPTTFSNLHLKINIDWLKNALTVSREL